MRHGWLSGLDRRPLTVQLRQFRISGRRGIVRDQSRDKFGYRNPGLRRASLKAAGRSGVDLDCPLPRSHGLVLIIQEAAKLP